jgi:hypothetical protein
MQQRDITKLDHILALLSSDNAGERASAAKAADAIIRKHKLTWLDVIEGKAGNVKGKGSVRRHEVGGVDYLAAAESRIRQLQAHNLRLEQQIMRHKSRLDEQ